MDLLSIAARFSAVEYLPTQMLEFVNGLAFERLAQEQAAPARLQPQVAAPAYLAQMVSLLTGLMAPDQKHETAPAPFHPSGMSAGAPPGYHAITGTVAPGVAAKAKSLLSQPMGSETPFEIDGKRYLARVEHHYHPPGFKGGPNGWHKGVTVYAA